MDNKEKKNSKGRKARSRSPRKRKHRSKRAKSEVAKRKQAKTKSSRKLNSEELSKMYAQRGRERRRRQVEEDMKRFQEEIEKKLQEDTEEPSETGVRRTPGEPYQMKRDDSLNRFDRKALWKLGASSVKAPKGFIKNMYMRPEHSSSQLHRSVKKSSSKGGVDKHNSKNVDHQDSHTSTSPRSV